MPKKKAVVIIEQPINLSPDVTVLIRAPRDKWPHIAWNGGHIEVSVEGAPVRKFMVATGAAQEIPTSNGPDAWTPELRAAQARLGADPLRQGGTVKREKKPYSTADAFRDLTDDNGKRVFDEDAGEGLTPEALIAAAAAGGDTVI